MEHCGVQGLTVVPGGCDGCVRCGRFCWPSAQAPLMGTGLPPGPMEAPNLIKCWGPFGPARPRSSWANLSPPPYGFLICNMGAVKPGPGGLGVRPTWAGEYSTYQWYCAVLSLREQFKKIHFSIPYLLTIYVLVMGANPDNIITVWKDWYIYGIVF